MARITSISSADLVKIQELVATELIPDDDGYVPCSINGVTYKVNFAAIIDEIKDEVNASKVDADKLLPIIQENVVKVEALQTHTHMKNSVELGGMILNGGKFSDKYLPDSVFKPVPEGNQIILVDGVPVSPPVGWDNIQAILIKSGTSTEFNAYANKKAHELIYLTDKLSLQLGYNTVNSGGGTVISYLPMVSVLEGVDADKPTDQYKGRMYYATDTSAIYYDTGFTWVQLNSVIIDPYHGRVPFILPVVSEPEGTGTGFNNEQFSISNKTFEDTKVIYKILDLREVNDNEED
jgi:hypothetical protein